jgi:hypothetical protein
MLLNLCQLTRLPEVCILLLAMAASVIGKCVNPGCEAEFKRLGTGKIYSFHVDKPLAWGLPPSVKQKVVWLCAKCATTKQVQFDQGRCEVLVTTRALVHKRSA